MRAVLAHHVGGLGGGRGLHDGIGLASYFKIRF